MLPQVMVDGSGVVSHVGTALLTELADRVGLTSGFSDALAGLRARRGGHDPGRVAVDVATVIADGGEVLSDVRMLADQQALHGPVASMATVWRLLNSIDEDTLAGLRRARAIARERAWAARGELAGTELPGSAVAGTMIEDVVIDLDATLVEAHSEKQQAGPHYKGGFGFHPLLAYLDNTGEALAGILRPGNAAAHHAGDHVRVLDLALTQVPDAWRCEPVLIRTDTAGCSHVLLDELTERGLEYSIGHRITDRIRSAISRAPSGRGLRRSPPTVGFGTAPTSPRSPTWST